MEKVSGKLWKILEKGHRMIPLESRKADLCEKYLETCRKFNSQLGVSFFFFIHLLICAYIVAHIRDF
jgi:hypothetical protein